MVWKRVVETDIFYLALFPEDKSCFINSHWLDSLPNLLEEPESESAEYSEVVKVCNLEDEELLIAADVVSQKVICFR